MDAFAQYNQQQMLARPSDSGAGGGMLQTALEGGLIGTVLGLKDTKGHFTGPQGFFEKKMMVWGSQRQLGPIARAFQEAVNTLKQGGQNMMEGVAAPLNNGAGQDFGYHEGQGINFSQVDSSASIAPAQTPAMEGVGALVPAFG